MLIVGNVKPLDSSCFATSLQQVNNKTWIWLCKDITHCHHICITMQYLSICSSDQCFIWWCLPVEMFSVSTAANGNVSVYLYAVSKIVVRDKTKETVHLAVLAIYLSTSLYIWDDSSSTDNCNIVCESKCQHSILIMQLAEPGSSIFVGESASVCSPPCTKFTFLQLLILGNKPKWNVGFCTW